MHSAGHIHRAGILPVAETGASRVSERIKGIITMADIFISYASEDREKVKPLAKALEEQDWSIFWDRTIPVRKSWREMIQSELESSKCVVVIWTENSINSKWVLAEVSEGYEKDILTQVLFENLTIPFPYKQEQAADLTNWKAGSIHSGFTILLKAISGIVGPSPLKLKEVEQNRAEEERILKQDNDEEKRLRQQEESLRFAEQKRELEKEKKRLIATPKAEEEPKVIEELVIDKSKGKISIVVIYAIVGSIIGIILLLLLYWPLDPTEVWASVIAGGGIGSITGSIVGAIYQRYKKAK